MLPILFIFECALIGFLIAGTQGALIGLAIVLAVVLFVSAKGEADRQKAVKGL